MAGVLDVKVWKAKSGELKIERRIYAHFVAAVSTLMCQAFFETFVIRDVHDVRSDEGLTAGKPGTLKWRIHRTAWLSGTLVTRSWVEVEFKFRRQTAF